jgi:hypothetical protein
MSNKGLLNEQLEPLIFAVRERRIILDADLARLYGVTTKALNQAVRRNWKRFPPDFAFQLETSEFELLRSQIVTAKMQAPERKSEIASSGIPNNPKRRGGTRVPPWAFSEHGALMAANVLRSERAVQMSVFVVRAFVRLREQVAANEAILKRLAEVDKALLEHDAALRDLYRKLLPLLQPPPESRKRSIGFHTGNE